MGSSPSNGFGGGEDGFRSANARLTHRTRAPAVIIMDSGAREGRMFRLQAFGNPALFKESEQLAHGLSWQTRRFAVLIYLACDARPGPHRRDEVIATFWPKSDLSRGRNALRQALHVIRGEIGEDVFLAAGSQDLWVNPVQLDSDVRAFSHALGEGLWEKAVSLYRGDFLEGFYLNGGRRFEFWVEERRSSLKERAVGAAQNLARRAETQRDLEEALSWWRRALELYPYHEGFIRRILCLLAGSGNCGEGIAEFERFRSRLRAELGVTPSEETLELVSRVTKGQVREVELWMGEPGRDYERPSRYRGPRTWRGPKDLAPS